MIGDLMPRLTTKIVVVSVGPADIYLLDERAAVRLHELGYTDVAILEGGISGWSDAGFKLFSGVGSSSKAFGEWIAATYTPYVTVQEDHHKMENHENLYILDCRPESEYHRMTIPGSINAPGADLVYRVHDVVTDPNTLNGFYSQKFQVGKGNKGPWNGAMALSQTSFGNVIPFHILGGMTTRGKAKAL
jgi:rhodanese-related sulfurtransferase